MLLKSTYFFLLFLLIFGCKKDKEELKVAVNANISSPELISPRNNEMLPNVNSVTMRWKQIEKAKQYIILLSLDSNFNTIIDKDEIYYNTYYSYVSPNNEKLHGTFYWKVKAIDSNGVESEFSPIYKVNCLYNYEVSPEIFSSSKETYTADPYLFLPTIHWYRMVGALEYEVSDNGVSKDIVKADSFKLNLCYVRWASNNKIKVRAKLIDNTYTNYSELIVKAYDPRVEHIGEYQIKFSSGFNNYEGPAIFKSVGNGGGVQLEINGTYVGFYGLIDFFNCPMEKGSYFYIVAKNLTKIQFKDRNDTTFVDGGNSAGNCWWSAYRVK